MSFLGLASKIRVRLVLGFLAAFLGMALFGVISYRYFINVEDKLLFLSQADGLLNTFLEARRYEKNYFLYGHEKDFEQALTYLSDFDRLLKSQRRHLIEKVGGEAYDRLRSLAEAYRDHFERIHGLMTEGGSPDGRAEETIRALRSLGQQLIAGGEELAAQERRSIQALLQNYRPLLIAFLLALSGIGALMAYFLIIRLVRPLHSIEEATKIVAEGEYQTIPWSGRRDEIGSLVQGFNRMVGQLRQNNERMIQTEKLTALGTLTSGVAHELNNPLNNISTSCQILLEEMGGGVSDYHRQLLAALEEQVSKAKDIVSLLLEYARQREFELRPEDLRAVVEETLKLIKGEIPKEIEVRLDIPPGISVAMDKVHLVQALINLIMNGIQAMPHGGRLTLTGRASAFVEEASLEVSDTGGGIPPEIMPRIFDPFFTTKEVGRGTGLGLSITHSIITRHQGRSQVHSQPGQGVTFRLTLPLRAGRG